MQFTHAQPHEPLQHTHLVVDIDDLTYDLDNPRTRWIYGKTFSSVEEYEQALEQYSNVKKLMTSIRDYGILSELIVEPYTDKGNRTKYRVKSGNTRLYAARKLNRLAARDGFGPLVKKVSVVSYDPAVIKKYGATLLTADHRIPAKSWPLVERLRTAFEMSEEGKSDKKVADKMMVSEVEARRFIFAGGLFQVYLEETEQEWQEAAWAASFFVEAAKVPAEGVLGEHLRTPQGQLELAHWIDDERIARALDIRNIQKIADFKGLAFVQQQMTRKGKTVTGMIRSLSIEDIEALKLRDPDLLAYAA